MFYLIGLIVLLALAILTALLVALVFICRQLSEALFYLLGKIVDTSPSESSKEEEESKKGHRILFGQGLRGS